MLDSPTVHTSAGAEAIGSPRHDPERPSSGVTLTVPVGRQVSRIFWLLSPLLLAAGNIAYHVYGYRDTDPLLFFYVASTIPVAVLGLLIVMVSKVTIAGDAISVGRALGPRRRIRLAQVATSIWVPIMRVNVDVTTGLLVLRDPHGRPLLRLSGRRFPMAELGRFAVIIRASYPQTMIPRARAGAVSAAHRGAVPWNLRHPNLFVLGFATVALIAQVGIMLALS